MCEKDPLGSIEMQFSADDIAIAANEVSLVADSQLAVDGALEASSEAKSASEMLAAELQLQKAQLDKIAIRTTASRAAFELGKILDSDS